MIQEEQSGGISGPIIIYPLYVVYVYQQHYHDSAEGYNPSNIILRRQLHYLVCFNIIE